MCLALLLLWSTAYSFPHSRRGGCSGSAPAVGSACNSSVWIVPSNLTNMTVAFGQTILIDGTLVLPSTSTVVVTVSSNTSSAPIGTAGTATIEGGSLTVILLDVPPNGALIPIWSAENVSGGFSSLSVLSPSSDTCTNVSGMPEVNAADNTLSVLVTVNSCGGSGGLSAGAIVGIAVGGTAAVAALLIGVALFLYYMIPSARILFRVPARRRTRPARELVVAGL